MTSRNRHTAAASSAAQSEVREAPAAHAYGEGAKALRLQDKHVLAFEQRVARAETGLSQRQLAELHDMQPSLVADHELGHELPCATVLHVLSYARVEASRPIARAYQRVINAALGDEAMPLPKVRPMTPVQRLARVVRELNELQVVLAESEADGVCDVAELRARLKEARDVRDVVLEQIAHDEAELARLEGRDGR